eukprot:754626-Hanusia_phi.AAC.2
MGWDERCSLVAFSVYEYHIHSPKLINSIFVDSFEKKIKKRFKTNHILVSAAFYPRSDSLPHTPRGRLEPGLLKKSPVRGSAVSVPGVSRTWTR